MKHVLPRFRRPQTPGMHSGPAEDKGNDEDTTSCLSEAALVTLIALLRVWGRKNGPSITTENAEGASTHEKVYVLS